MAQHSHLVACLVCAYGGTRAQQFHALLHDAPEAYLGDVSAPLKGLLGSYGMLEGRLWGSVVKRFAITAVTPEDFQMVKRADEAAFHIEDRWLRGGTQRLTFNQERDSFHGVLRSMDVWSPEIARIRFLDLFKELTNG